MRVDGEDGDEDEGVDDVHDDDDKAKFDICNQCPPTQMLIAIACNANLAWPILPAPQRAQRCHKRGLSAVVFNALSVCMALIVFMRLLLGLG